MKHLYLAVLLPTFALAGGPADVVVSATKTKRPDVPEQAQEQEQFQTQGQEQHQTATAINEGVSAIAEGATVTQSINTDIPKVTLGLGGAYAPGSYATAPCMGPVEADAKRGGKTGIGVLGLFSRGAHLETKDWCVQLMEREMALREREMAVREAQAGLVNQLSDCEAGRQKATEGLQRCQERVTGAK